MVTWDVLYFYQLRKLILTPLSPPVISPVHFNEQAQSWTLRTDISSCSLYPNLTFAFGPREIIQLIYAKPVASKHGSKVLLTHALLDARVWSWSRAKTELAPPVPLEGQSFSLSQVVQDVTRYGRNKTATLIDLCLVSSTDHVTDCSVIPP